MILRKYSLGRVDLNYTHRLGTSLKMNKTTNRQNIQMAITYSNFVQIGHMRCFLTSTKQSSKITLMFFCASFVDILLCCFSFHYRPTHAMFFTDFGDNWLRLAPWFPKYDQLNSPLFKQWILGLIGKFLNPFDHWHVVVETKLFWSKCWILNYW